MITEEAPRRLAPQTCPLCGMLQNIEILGQETDGDKQYINNEKGYSFCNCNNIFFTDWSNIEQAVYDKDYEKRYDSEAVKICMEQYAGAYFDKLLERTDGRNFLEIGCVNPALLDCATAHGFSAGGLDIMPHDFHPHDMVTGNFEDLEIQEPLADVIWASHIFEHFKDPIQAGRKCFQLLNPKGILFVAMPDPFMIDWKEPYSWGHWHIKEHHILWDMDSFCAQMEKIGFKTILKHRNTSLGFICVADYHLMFQKGE